MRFAVRRPVAVLLVGAALITAACGAGPSTPTVSTPASNALAESPSRATVAPSISPLASSLLAAMDPTLLTHVPAAIDGIALTYDPATTESVAADPALGRDASALAMALAVAPGNSGSTDLAIVSVVRLRGGPMTESFFRNYRDSYDAAACSSAGGVSGHAEATINDRVVFIGSCAGGAFTYHVGLADGPLIVSATSVGAKRLGEKVMNGVTP